MEAKLKVSTTVKGKTQRKIQQREDDKKRPEAKRKDKRARETRDVVISDPGTRDKGHVRDKGQGTKGRETKAMCL